MKYIRLILVIVSCIATITSCVKFDYTSITEHPTQGSVELIPDWEEYEPEGEKIVVVNGEDVILNPEGTLPLMDEGEYEILTYNEIPTLIVDKTISDDVNPVGNVSVFLPVRDGFLASTHDMLYSEVKKIKVIKDSKMVVNVDVNPISKVLAFKLNIGEGDPERIAKIESYLSGVSDGWDLSNNKPVGNAVNIAPLFSKKDGNVTRVSQKMHLDARIVLLGISKSDGVKQILTLNLTFSDGRKLTIISDLTSKLLDFNSDKSIIMTLIGTIEIALASGTTGTVVDWLVEDGGDVDLD